MSTNAGEHVLVRGAPVLTHGPTTTGHRADEGMTLVIRNTGRPALTPRTASSVRYFP
ncbi:hypothetical protein PYK79_22365 [Streptomyces sp. ID05-04B]|nr:hypothetical protein [Streptomyces sp. ID05-04B]